MVYPGADVEHFTPGSDRATERTRRELGIPFLAKVVGFVGRLQRLKAPGVLLRAAAILVRRHPDLLLSVVICGGPSGSGKNSLEELQDLAKELGIAHIVRFLSPRPAEELVSIYQAADLIAVPSYNESFGLVAVEAQASGTPVVAADVGGLSIAVDNGKSGLLVEGHEPEVWADALGELLIDDERRIEMSEYAPIHASRFSWEKAAESLRAIYAELPKSVRNATRNPAG